MSKLFNSRVLNGKVNFPLCLAPMVGLSHVALRMMTREYLPEDAVTIWPTEMLNSNKVPKEDLQIVPEAMRHKDESEMVPQILGNQELPIAQSLEKLTAWGAEAVDINMGCPVKKALKHNYGVALMGDPQYAAEVVSMAVRNSHIPISVKLRAGLQNDEDFLLNFVKGIEEAGAQWITLHPRTAEQKRRGQADWGQIKRIKKELKIPLIGNGDIQTADDVITMLTETGCDMVMSGRALAARPWMLWQLGEKMGLPAPAAFRGEKAPQSELEEGRAYGQSLLRLLHYLQLFMNEELAVKKFRFHVRTTAAWLDFGHTLHALTTKFHTFAELEREISKFFQNDMRMYQKTDLRQ